MENFISYYRMSVLRAGSTVENSYGLEAQRKDVERYVAGVGGNITASYTEVETGTKRRKRIEVYKAIAACKQSNSTLIVAKLDRLARDVEFISSLINSGVKFLIVDNPTATPMVLHILAAVAQSEAETIRQRIIKGLEVAKSKGVKLGYTATLTSEGRKNGLATRVALAHNNINNMRAMGYITVLRNGGMTFQAIADKLNSESFFTSTGKQFTPKAVQLLYIRATTKQAA